MLLVPADCVAHDLAAVHVVSRRFTLKPPCYFGNPYPRLRTILLLKMEVRKRKAVGRAAPKARRPRAPGASAPVSGCLGSATVYQWEIDPKLIFIV